MHVPASISRASARGRTVSRVAGAGGRSRSRDRGISLIIAMLMLAIIGLASAAIMRNATSGGQVATNNRLQTQASQYAQLALRFCENQLALAPAARSVAVAPGSSGAPPAWTVQSNWATGGAHLAHTLAAADIGSAVQPRVPPQCLAEATTTDKVYTVTARGFSPDFRADARSGITRSGSVVWLQATLYAEGGAGGGLSIERRMWQQLLTPPF
jgi:hypothetical protein